MKVVSRASLKRRSQQSSRSLRSSRHQKRPASSKKAWQHFTFICAVEIVVKIKAIARIEGFSIREVVEKFLRDGIARYEQKHGAVTNRKKSVDEVL